MCVKGCVCVCRKGCVCVCVGRGVYVCVGRGCVCVCGKGVRGGWGTWFLLQMGLNPRSLDPVSSASAASHADPTQRACAVSRRSVSSV